MKIKLPKPEDYPEIDGIGFKTIHAYANLYSNTTSLLIKMKTITCMVDDGSCDKEWALKKIKEYINPFIEES